MTEVVFQGEDLQVTREGPALTLTLQRPPVNAFRTRTWEELAAALAAASLVSGVSVLVIRSGVPGIFSAGADVREPPASPELQHHREELARTTLAALGRHPCPVIAVVDGPAMGGACSIISQADIRLASPRARFAIPEINVGRCGGARHLMRHLDQGTVRWMAFTGQALDAAQAGGLVTVLAEDVDAKTDALVSTLAAKSPLALRLLKQAVDQAELLGVDEGYGVEQAFSRRLASSPDAIEAAAAFREKRAPVWGPPQVQEAQA